MATTMKLIGKTTLGSAASTVEFADIPATYTDLLIVCSLRGNGTVGNSYIPIVYQFNGSTSGYTARLLRGTGSGAGSSTNTTVSWLSSTYGRITDYGFPSSGATSNTFGQFSMYIPNYAGSTNKSWSSELAHEDNASAAYIEACAGLWSNTAAITSVKFASYATSVSFAADSSFFLYGITKA